VAVILRPRPPARAAGGLPLGMPDELHADSPRQALAGRPRRPRVLRGRVPPTCDAAAARRFVVPPHKALRRAPPGPVAMGTSLCRPRPGHAAVMPWPWPP